jgi:hypothetical protein
MLRHVLTVAIDALATLITGWRNISIRRRCTAKKLEQRSAEPTSVTRHGAGEFVPAAVPALRWRKFPRRK